MPVQITSILFDLLFAIAISLIAKDELCMYQHSNRFVSPELFLISLLIQHNCIKDIKDSLMLLYANFKLKNLWTLRLRRWGRRGILSYAERVVHFIMQSSREAFPITKKN